jgi:hypothetical protein
MNTEKESVRQYCAARQFIAGEPELGNARQYPNRWPPMNADERG